MADTSSMTWNEVLRICADAILNGTQVDPATLGVISANLAALVTAAQSTAAVNTYPAPTTPVSGKTSAMTATTSTSLLAAPGANLRNYVTAIVISNADADTDTELVLQDGSGGTELMRFPAPKGYGGCTLALPTPLKQPTANTALYCACTVSGSTTTVSVVGYTA